MSHLVANGLADPREIAIAASQEFGVPLLDLDAIQPDLDTVKLVSDKLLAKHRVLPLVKRGKRLFVAVSDPTNLHALDEIKFQTGLSVEAVVVEEDKLQRFATKAIEQVDTQMPALGDDDLDLENLDVTGGDEDARRTPSAATTSKTRRSCASSTRCCSTPSRKAPPTSISSRTRRPTASACAWTAI